MAARKPRTSNARRATRAPSNQESVYRGRKIEVQRADGRGRTRLFIDGTEIELEESELGVMSHDNMFKVYGSPFELAEDLIRQWGNAPIRPAEKPHDHPHHPKRSKK